MSATYLCPDCGIPIPSRRVEVNHETREATIYLADHHCNPALLKFFNPDSQHFRPFTR